MSKRLTKTIWYGSDVDSNGNPILPSTHGGLDGLNYGELFLHLSNGKATLWTLSSDGKIVEITGGGSEVDMSSYLLKSIWDKVFEIRTDSQGTEYIFGKLPMVTQYGITMYSGDGVNVPSLASGLPFDGRTIWYNPDTQQIEVIGGTGGGSGEGVSNFWDLSGIPSWITNSKPKYTYSEIEGTPDLSGYATESWVLGKSYITSATLGTKLAKYVTLDTDQPLKGKKDFKNGLSIDGLEIRKSQDDVVYIDANLVVRGGVTMYAQNEVDIPPIIDSIPTASTTVKGIASFDGAYFSVVNGKVSLIASNVGLNEEELYNYLTSNNYAKKSDIPSLSGYATESWVTKQNYATKSTTLSGYGITDAYTKTNVDDLLKSYVTLGGTQTITGEKNFTGGLKVNGSPIVYDSAKKYWKLEGDLLVTGGVTMYGSDSSFTPSTIMDAIVVDGTTISKDGGVLKVIGGTGGGVADSVAWANITGKPTFASVATSGKYSDLSGTPSSLPASDVYSWAKAANKPSYTWSEITSKPTWIGSSKPTYSYSEITGAISTTDLQNYLTQNSYLNVTSGDNRYLKLSGGAINGTSNSPFTINTSSQAIELQLKSNSNIKAYIGWNTTDGVFLQEGENTAYIGVQTNKNPYYFNGTRYTLWHAGNDGSGSGLDADLLDGQEETTFAKWKSGISSSDEYRHIGYAYGSGGWKTSGAAMSFGADKSYFMQIQGGGSTAKEVFLYARYIYNGIYSDWKTIAFTDSNVASATRVMMNYSYNQDVNYPLVFTSRDNIGVAQNATLCIDFSGRPTYNPKTDTLTVGNLSGNATYATNSSKLYSTDIIYSYGSTNPYYGYLTFNQTYGEWDFKVSPNTPEYIHVYSSDKLRTARTIWGQSFDGSGNVSGNLNLAYNKLYIGDGSDNFYIGWGANNCYVYQNYYGHYFTTKGERRMTIDGSGNVGIGTTSPNQKLHVEGGVRVNGQIIGANSIVSNTTNGFFVGNRNDGLGVTDGGLLLYTYGKTPISFYASGERMRIDASTGNVGIGTTNPSEKLHVDGNVIFEGSNTYLSLNRKSTDGGILFKHNGTNKWQMVNYDSGLNFYDHYRGKTALIIGTDGVLKFEGNILSTGGITMYSDQRKKTILNHVELSLKQIADAPLIEHYYNSDDKKTTHVGSIAQYWASMNDWFCKLDSEGFYTMEIQNAALASAISIARELDRYESKTDKAIKKLKKRICELEEEIERLKSA